MNEIDITEQQQPFEPATRRRRMPVWPFFVAALMLLIGSFVFAVVAIPISLPYYAMSPGPVSDVSDYIEVGDRPDTTQGEMFFLTVSLSSQEVNVLEWMAAKLDARVDLAPVENIRPAGVSQEEVRRQNLELMNRSKENAKYVALSYLGYEVTYNGSGALINSTIEGSAAEGALQEGDVIVAVAGEPVEFSTDAVDLIGGRSPGDELILTIERVDLEDPDVVTTMDVTLVLGPYRYEDEDGNVLDDPDRGMVGVLLSDAPVEVVFPVDVEIDSQNIGGPSAGMMFTLEIIDSLTQEDLTKGRRIAGTGTIDAEGNVGRIGGMRQKTFGAIDAGAEYLLVPAGNYEEALEAAGDDITVVSISTLEDAILFLESLAAA
ncbi:MAG: PDZ domain-containing protein [Acidimicrobiia bacterium]|nr:PDZ domain-containing protein [Acidimicrobiia bacterium]